MQDLSGVWEGEFTGTNQGRMVIKFTHEGDRVYGAGHFNEPTVGVYRYQVQGIVSEGVIKLFLTPGERSHAGIALGNVEAEASLDSQGNINGSWASSIGTTGSFSVARTPIQEAAQEDTSPKNNAVFIVHGHDDATKEKIARFIEKLGLEAIILHEQVNKGMTIIEKFEEYSRKARFAVVLFTPDDVAYPLGDEQESRPRARQNVVLEMGYFIGTLGRDKVCVLYKGDVELPSDILGVVYTKIDDAEAWKLNVAKELKLAGYDIDLNKLIS